MIEAKTIPLTQGKEAIVDASDYTFLNQRKWYAWKPQNSTQNYYALTKIRFSGRQYTVSMHRALLSTPANMHTDHINGNSLDNRKSNLRICNRAENNWNSPSHLNSSSHYKGVTWHKQRSKWQVYCGGQYQGLFDNEKQAALKYNEALRLLNIEYAYYNEVKI